MDDGKKYQLGFVVGRFQMFHIGHMSIIDACRKNAERCVVLIGSSDKSRTEKNPFSFEERKQMIEKVFSDVEIFPLPDIGVGDVPLWGDYLFSTIQKHCHREPDLYVSGKEDKVDHWFDAEKRSRLKTIKVDRSSIPICASQLREYLRKGEQKEWEKYVSPSLHPSYQKYRSILLSVEKNG